MNKPLELLEKLNISFKPLENLLLTILLIVVFLIVRMIFYKGIKGFGAKKFLSPERIKRTERFVLFFVGITIFSTLLLVWGVKLKEFFLIIATTFTIIGTACFASWSNLSNISSGIILFFNYNIKLGDKVRLGNGSDQVEGVVHNMKLFYVEIITIENELVFYPNNMILHQPITILKK